MSRITDRLSWLAIAGLLTGAWVAQAQEPAEVVDAGAGEVADAGAGEGRVLESFVVGTPEERTAGSVHTIKGSKLNRFELDDPGAILQAVPGVYVRGEDGFGLRPNIGLRGANADRSKKVTLMEDGVLLGPAPYSAPAAYYFPMMTRMESVRVVKGPGAIMYGPQTVGGAIDLITRDAPSGLTAGADVSIGQYLSGKAHGWFGGGTETSSFVIEGVHLRSNGFKQLSGGSDTGFIRNEWMVKGRHVLEARGLRHAFTVKLGFANESSNETYLGLTDADFRANPLRRYDASLLDRMEWVRTQLTLTHRVELGPVTWTTTIYRHDFHRTWNKANRFGAAALADVLSAPTTPRNAVFYAVLSGEQDSSSVGERLFIGPNRRGYVSQGIQTGARTAFKTGPVGHALELQLRYHFDAIERLHTEDAYELREGRPVLVGQPTITQVSNRDATHAVAFHANDAIALGPVTLTPGIRVEVIRSETKNRLTGSFSRGATEVVLPGLGAHWAAHQAFGIFGGVYRGFSPPAPGQPSIVQPESSINWEAGARWARPQERVELIGFFNDYANLTDVCTFSNGCVGANLDRQFDAGRANIFGLEAYAEKTWRFGAVKVPASAAYTLTKTRLLQDFASEDPQLGNVKPGDELPYVPMHQLNVSAGVDVWRIALHAQLNFVDRMREQAGSGPLVDATATDAQVVLDLHLGVRVNDYLQLYCDVRNALDNRALVSRRPFGARPSAPRMILGGLKLTY